MSGFNINPETTATAGKQKTIKSYAPYIILILLVALAFANSLQNEFVWDDEYLIINNPQINLPLKEIPSVFTTPLWKLAGFHEYHQVYYRPIAYIYSVLNYKIWGLNPLGFHLTNIIMHLIVTMLLYKTGLLIFRLSESPINNDKLISLIAASIFAVHPVHNESVGRVAIGEVIFGFFVILSIYFFLKEKRYLSWFMFIFALLSKEAAVMLPFALIIFSIHKRGVKKGMIEIMPYIALVGIYLVLRSQVVDTVFGDKVSQPRILTMAVATFDYIRLLLIPYPLSPFYPARWYTSIFEPKVLITIIFLILIFVLAVKVRRDKVMLFLLIFPFLMLAPVIWRVNTFPVGNFDSVYIAERFLYVPAMLFSFFVSAYAAKFFKDRKTYLLSGWMSIITIFTIITVSANAIWRNDLTLFGKIANDTPKAIFAHNNLGLAYYAQGRLDEAIQAFETVIKLNPYSTAAMNAHSSMGAIYIDQGRLSEAIHEFQKVLRIDYNNAYVHNNLGNAYYVQKRLREAIQEYKISLELKSNNIKVHRNIAMAYVEIGEIDKGIQHYRIALQMFPNDAETHNNLGIAYKQKGLINEAIREFQTALKLNPDLIEARQNLSSLQR